MKLKLFTFGPFAENTYILYDDSKEAVIIDPGCLSASEQTELTGFITENELKPVKLLNTHCHIDHIAGNAFIADKYKLELGIPEPELELLNRAPEQAMMFGIRIEPSPAPAYYIREGENISFGETELEVLFTPGHSPGHVVFYIRPENTLVAGDVLFNGSIGRTDLYKGDFDTLAKSIREKLYKLPDETRVYPGHGDPTTIGKEKRSNPFVPAL